MNNTGTSNAFNAETACESGHIHIEGHIIEGQTHEDGQDGQEGSGHEVRVTIIRGGVSKNGYSYNDDALRAIAQLVEGAHAYADHGQDERGQNGGQNAVRSVRDIVGFYHDAHFQPATASDGNGRVDATLHLFDAASWLWSLLQEAYKLGRPDLIGLSVDLFGNWRQNGRVKEVTHVLSLNSCDVVTRPSAGGAFRRILHDVSSIPSIISTIPSTHSTTDSKGDISNMSQETLSEHSQATSPQETLSEHETPSQSSPTHIQEARIAEQEVQGLMQELRMERAQLLLERRLLESVLPEPARAQIRFRFQGRIVEEHEIDAEIRAQQELLAALSAQGLIRGNGYEKPSIGGMVTEAEKVQAAFDRMFELDIDTTKLGNVRAFGSIREAYARVTGDASVTGFSERSQLGTIRVSESAPIGRITEADTTTASFSYLLGTSMNKRLLKDYQAWPAEWMKFCSIAPIRDFKQQTRVRFGAFGSLPIVAEDTAYSAVSLTDSAATYVAQKRGNLVTVSREVIINDDLQAVKQIPMKLAVAAAYTLAEFVYGFLSSNPNIYDSNPLFTSGAPHSNLGASNLSTTAMQSGVTAMREQTNYAGKRIGLRPRYLIVPPELEWTGMVVTKSAGVPGSPNNDINPMLGYVTPIVSPQLTSPTQWFLVGDPREIDTIEIGFVGGQVNPALYIQDQPLFGMNFSTDVISFKVRHEFGGCVTDYRGLYRGL